MTGRVAPGWYPDYEAPPGHQRYWDGARWTERRSGASATVPARAGRSPSRRWSRWLLGAAAVVLATSVVVVLLGRDGAGPSQATSPPPASTPGPPPGAPASPSASQAPAPTSTSGSTPEPSTLQVGTVVDGSTLRLTNGVEVRLVGIEDSCGADELGRILAGRSVTLIRPGADQDADGRLLRYVDRDGLDVGKRLIQKGWATASPEPNPRRAIYQRIDGRSTDRC